MSSQRDKPQIQPVGMLAHDSCPYRIRSMAVVITEQLCDKLNRAQMLLTGTAHLQSLTDASHSRRRAKRM